MNTRRRKSVPPLLPQSIISSSDSSNLSDLSSMSTPPSTVIPSTDPTSIVQPRQPLAPATDDKLRARAEALAKMTFEINIRKVDVQVNSLEKTVKELVQVTADNKEFRKENEARLSDLWREMLAVKQQALKIEDAQSSTSSAVVGLEALQKETAEVVCDFRKEVAELKESLGEVSQLMDGLTKQPQANPQPLHTTTPHHLSKSNSNESGYGSLVDYESDLGVDLQPTQKMEHLGSRNPPSNNDKRALPPSFSPNSPSGTHTRTQVSTVPMTRARTRKVESRIEEAIKSTRRWNRDHKTTPYKDSVFCANYLKQQSKRDQDIAVHIQRSIGKRVSRRLGPLRSRQPTSLEEFCQDVTWQDVLDTVQETLVEEKQAVIREFGG